MSQLNSPCGVFVSNGEVFISDTINHCIRKVLSNGQIVTIAGNGIERRGEINDGQLATNVHLSTPTCVVVSSSNQVYISEGNNNRIRKIDRNGIILTIAGTGQEGYNGDNQLAVNAQLCKPRGLFVNEDEEVFFCDWANHRNGSADYNGDDILATSAQLNYPSHVFVYKNEIYITDRSNNRIRKVLQNGMIKTIAGTGQYGCTGSNRQIQDGQLATITGLYNPVGLYVHNDQVFFSDFVSVRTILPNGIVNTIAENRSHILEDGILAINARILHPYGIYVNDSGIYIACCGDSRVRKIDHHNGMITTIAGTIVEQGYSDDVPFDFQQYPHIGPRKKQFIKPFPKSYHDMVIHFCNQHNEECECYETLNKKVYISEDGNSRIRKIDRNGVISTIAGTGVYGYNGDNQLAVNAQLEGPRGLFVTDDEEVFFCEFENHRVRKIDQYGIITTVAGNGIKGYNGDDILATSAQLQFPADVFVHKNEIYITDSRNNRIRKVLQDGKIVTIAGTGENGNEDGQLATTTKLRTPYGLYIHNDQIYFSDVSGCVRKILPNGTITTVVGKGDGILAEFKGGKGDGTLAINAYLISPFGIFVDDSGIFIACIGNSEVKKVDGNGVISTIAGTIEEEGYSGDVPFDFEKYPHIGPKKKQWIKPFPKSYHDIVIHFYNHHNEECECHEPLNKKVKR